MFLLSGQKSIFCTLWEKLCAASKNDHLLQWARHPLPPCNVSARLNYVRRLQARKYGVLNIFLTCRMPQSGKLPILFLRRCQKPAFFPVGTIDCTDSREIRHGRGVSRSAWPCKISPESVHGDGYKAPGANTLTNFYKCQELICAKLPCTSVLNLTRFASQVTDLLQKNRASVIYPDFFSCTLQEKQCVGSKNDRHLLERSVIRRKRRNKPIRNKVRLFGRTCWSGDINSSVSTTRVPLTQTPPADMTRTASPAQTHKQQHKCSPVPRQTGETCLTIEIWNVSLTVMTLQT